MSGKLCSISTRSATNAAAEVALVAATIKTVLQLATTSGTNLPRAIVKQWGIFFDGTATTNEPVEVHLIRQTTAGTSTTVTPVAVGDSADTILSVGGYNFSAEPTYGNILKTIECHPQAGYCEMLPLGMEIVVPANSRLGIAVKAPQAVNCHAFMIFEE